MSQAIKVGDKVQVSAPGEYDEAYGEVERIGKDDKGWMIFPETVYFVRVQNHYTCQDEVLKLDPRHVHPL